MVIMLANDECPKLGCVPGCFSNGAYCDCPTFAAPAKCVKTCGGWKKMRLIKPQKKTRKINIVVMLADDECPVSGCVQDCFTGSGTKCNCPIFSTTYCVKTCPG